MSEDGYRGKWLVVALLCASGLAGEARLSAQSPKQNDATRPPTVIEQPYIEAPIFRDTPLGHYPRYGDATGPGEGYRHYDLPSWYYGIWYRPRAFGLTKRQRCRPRPFRPRGYGSLFNRQCTAHRLDYKRYEVYEQKSEYGPAYYGLQEDGRCDKCCLKKCCLKKCCLSKRDDECEPCR